MSPNLLAVAETIWASGHHSVMVSLTITERRRRHVKLYRDAGGLYVRLGKRGTCKTYLTDMSGGRVVAPDLVVFYE